MVMFRANQLGLETKLPHKIIPLYSHEKAYVALCYARFLMLYTKTILKRFFYSKSKLIHSLFLIFFSIITVSSSTVSNLGTYGNTFLIDEESLEEFIKRKLKNLSAKELLHHQLNIQRNVVKSANRPKTVLCNACVSNKERLFDPSFVTKRPLIIKGKIIARKGQIINPLKFLPLTSTLLFINGDSNSEVNWALSQKGNTKIILTKGSPFILQEKFNTNIYFDQKGVFKKRFSISCTPTIVMQKENLISISHISLDKTGGD